MMELTTYEAHRKALVFWGWLRDNPELSKYQIATEHLSREDKYVLKYYSYCWLCVQSQRCDNCALSGNTGTQQYYCTSDGQPYEKWRLARARRDIKACAIWATLVYQQIAAWLYNNKEGEIMNKFFVFNKEDGEVCVHDTEAIALEDVKDLIQEDCVNASNIIVVEGHELKVVASDVTLER